MRRMSHDSIDVSYVANLARINLTEDECQRFGKQLDGIMVHIEKLSELDVDGVPPSAHPYETMGNTRPDEAVDSLQADDFLQNAPDQSQGQLRVPKVVDA